MDWKMSTCLESYNIMYTNERDHDHGPKREYSTHDVILFPFLIADLC